MKKFLSYILPVLLFNGILILGYIKIIYHHEIWDGYYFNFDIVIIGLYVLWILYEVKVSQNDVTQNDAVSDYGTRELYGLSQAMTVFSALWFDPVWHKPGIYHCIGGTIFILGVCFRIWAIRSLGTYYSHTVRKIAEHKIIDSGPYKYLRHPAYAGMITAHLGITIFYFNYITCAILALLLIPSIIMRIYVEEKTLMTVEGYKEFSKRRKRIIPYVW
jgi:protein-S-isoprenylcysteine O-methyltransferase Ste14